MRQIYTWMLTAAIPLLASCSQEEFKEGIVPPGNSLYISSAILTSGGHTETEAVTRASAEGVPVAVTKGSLGIFRSKGTGYTSTLDNVKYTYTGADKGWQPTAAADTLFLNGDDADVCAYYPYNSDAEYSDKTAVPLVSGKYTGTTATHDPLDLCYATNRTLNGSKRATTFELKHAKAMLELKITKDADYKGDCRVTSVTILNPELINDSRINITDGTYTTGVKDGVLNYNPATDADGILIGSTASTTAALLVPFTPTADGVTIAFAVNGVPVEAVIPNDKMPKVKAGHRYTVNIVMKATSMQVTGVDMMPWEETGVGGDDYTWYPTEDVIRLTSPIHVASYDWLWSNLDYKDGAIVLRDYQTWPDYTEYMLVWPYCTLTANNDMNVVAGNSAYSYATDPCSQIEPAGKWALPTRHQLELLLGTDHVQQNDGCWFGTATPIDAKKDDGTYLFLPSYIVQRSDDGMPTFDTGGYWMSDGSNQELFCVGKSTIYDTFPSFSKLGATNSSTYYNASVRCVEKPHETIILDGVEWAMGNLVKKDDGTYVIDDFQAAMPPYTGSNPTGGVWADVKSGYHFTWNSLDRKSMAVDAAYDYDVANDPCAKVAPAGTWRTPTKEEFEKAINQGQVKGTYTINDIEVSGYYLGTSTKPAKGGGDEYLFLPSAGGGDQSSYYTFYSNYWTSTEDGTAGGSLAYKFSASEYGTEGTVISEGKSYPAAVRCVKGSLEKVYTLTKTAEVKIGTVTYARTNLNHDFTFEAEPWISGKLNGVDLDYWYWGRKTPSSDGVYTKDVEDWSVLTGDEEDPCKSVSGGGWRLPTQSELVALAKKAMPADTKVNINGEILTVTGSNGFVKNASETTGGTVFYDSTTKNVLFLPAAGTEDTIGNISNPVLKGGYQSSTAMKGGTGCMPLSISQNTLGVAVPGWSYRYTGNSIRCVKN